MRKVILFFLTILMTTSCRKQDCLRKFEFHFPATITQRDTFNIGDTLWIEMDLPNEFIDHQTGEEINLSNFDLYLSFNVDKVDTMYANNAIHDFGIIESVGIYEEQVRGSFIYSYVYFDSIMHNKITLGIKPRKSGIYLLALTLPVEYFDAERADNREDRLKITEDKCSYQDITEYSGVHFNNGAINYYLLENRLCQTASPSDTLTICLDDSTTLAGRGGYAFLVQ